MLGSVLEWRADFEGCQRYLQEGASLSERTQSGRALGAALFHLGHSYMARGRYQQALRWYGGVHEYAREANDRYWIARHPSILAGLHLELFDAESAVELCREGGEIAKRVSAGPSPGGHSFVQLGLAHLQRGERGAAEESLRRAWDLLDGDGWQRWCWHIPLLRGRAEIALAAGNLDDALSYATQARQLATQADARHEVAHVGLLLGEIAVAQERLPEAVQLLRGASTLAEHINAAYVLWRCGGTLGGILANMGEDRAAETYLTQAAQTIEAIATELTDDALRTSFMRADAVAGSTTSRPPPSPRGSRSPLTALEGGAGVSPARRAVSSGACRRVSSTRYAPWKGETPSGDFDPAAWANAVIHSGSGGGRLSRWRSAPSVLEHRESRARALRARGERALHRDF